METVPGLVFRLSLDQPLCLARCGDDGLGQEAGCFDGRAPLSGPRVRPAHRSHKEGTASLPVNAIVLGVEDRDRAKKSCAEGLSFKIGKERAVKLAPASSHPSACRAGSPAQGGGGARRGRRPPVTITVNGHT
jgi:hypothetical protein